MQVAVEGDAMTVMDATDRAILDELRRDARASMTAIADAVHISRAGAHARIKRLTDAGVITGYRATVDAELAPRLKSLGDRKVVAEAKTLAYRLDPDGYVQRQRTAESDRRVTLRPAPDTMTKLTALLPVAQGVAVYAALRQAADRCVTTGDGRTLLPRPIDCSAG